MSTGYPVNDQVSLEDPYLSKIAYQINRNSAPIVVPVIEEPMPFGNCYWNVDAMVQKNGGSMVLGWDVSLWTNSHLAAVHHAIYKDPDGKFYDLSERMSGSSSMRETVFIPDNNITISIDRLPSIGMQFLIIKNSVAVKKYIDAYRKLNEIEKENSRTLYGFGFRCEPNKDLARGLPPRASEFSESEVRKLQQIASSIHQAKVILGKAITNLKVHTDVNE